MAKIDDEIAALSTQVTSMQDTVQSAATVISGISDKIKQAVQEALAAGATPEELQAITDVTNALAAQQQTLATAIASQGQPAPSPTP